jgi:8-oxo-dGTP pyrophosphatase MutT (NUDIX family)
VTRTWIAPSPALAAIVDRLAFALAAPQRRYEALIVAGRTIGWIIPERALRLAQWREVFACSARGIELAPALDSATARTAAFAAVARTLSEEGALSAWRDERYAVAPRPDAEPLFELERSAARYFGVHTFAAHANGLVGDPDRWRMWLARRSAAKSIDPGLLDNLVGGGIAAGSGTTATLIKEAFEEAGVPAELARLARSVAWVDICRDRPDGLQRETIYAYDLRLPEDFVPVNQDGEAVGHRLCEPETVLGILAGDDITGEASLVIVDFLLRRGHVDRRDPAFGALEALCRPSDPRLAPRPP